MYLKVFLGLICLSGAFAGVTQTRIKDLVEIRGVRSNSLMGFGLVIGLPGTGDSKSSLITNRAAAQLLSQLGPEVSPTEVLTKNIAAVMVTSDLPPFARIGDDIGIRLSSIGDSSSLEGGTLISTPLKALNGEIYAHAQGSISQGMGMVGRMGAAIKGTVPKTVALSYGAKVEKELQVTFIQPHGKLELSLKNPDFTTASRISEAINLQFKEFIAEAKNSRVIHIKLPTSYNKGEDPVSFVAQLEQITVEPDSRSRIVINERTGTVIAGHQVSIAPVAISHGSLEITIEDEKPKLIGSIPGASNVGELVKALNVLGAGPRDLIAIFQTLVASKVLNGELIIL